MTFVNVYRTPGNGTEQVEALARVPIPTYEPIVVAGDFNAVYWTWQPGYTGQDRTVVARGIAEWLDDAAPVNYNPPGQSTSEVGNTTDFVNRNIPNTKLRVEKEMYSG